MADLPPLNVSNQNLHLNETAPASNVFNKQPREKNFVDITNLIRSVQRSEGNPDCFQRAKDYCDRTDCAWRQYCLESDAADKIAETNDEENTDSLQSF